MGSVVGEIAGMTNVDTGLVVGMKTGTFVGMAEGCSVKRSDGTSVGAGVGTNVGDKIPKIPPPQAQHISLAVKSVSSNPPHHGGYVA